MRRHFCFAVSSEWQQTNSSPSSFNLWRSYERGRAAAETAGVEPPTLHECRHGYAAINIAAGVNAKALSTYMGHANIRITFDQYGHLMPGNEDEAAALVDEYLARALGDSTPPQTPPHPTQTHAESGLA